MTNFYQTPEGKRRDDDIEGESVAQAMDSIDDAVQTGDGAAPATGGTRNHHGTPAAATGITGKGDSA